MGSLSFELGTIIIQKFLEVKGFSKSFWIFQVLYKIIFKDLCKMTNKELLSPMLIADNIRERAKTQHIVLKDMLTTLHINKNTIATMRGGHYPRIDTLDKIAKFLGCSIESLIYKD